MNNYVAPERSGWRDQSISEHHRLWGVVCKMTDIDWICLEYHQNYNVIKPAAIVEYKHQDAPPENINKPQYRAIQHMADAANLPFFVVRYAKDWQTFSITPVNDWAKTILHAERPMTEEQYVQLLYDLRKAGPLPAYVLENIKKGRREKNLFE